MALAETILAGLFAAALVFAFVLDSIKAVLFHKLQMA
jgi:hypothetical protein